MFNKRTYPYRISFIIIIVFFLFQTCSDSGGDPVMGQLPEIELIHVNSNWNLVYAFYNRIEVKVSDPQGIDNIDSVKVSISNSTGETVLTDLLYDDGGYYHTNDGDVFAGDGLFSNRFDAASDIDTTVGTYQIKIQAYDHDSNVSEPAYASINLGYSYPSEFSTIQLPDTLKSGVSAAYIYTALSQTEGVQAIEDVTFNLYNYNSTDLLESQTMFNDGDFNNSGDLVANDSVFSFKLDYSFAAEREGLYDIEFVINDIFGLSTKSEKYAIFLENKVGEITEINVPERMQRPTLPGSYNRELLTASVLDPQGLTDIDSVYFFSLKPDGTYANSGNPIILVDNGKPFNIANPGEEAGDNIADDGIYSFSLLLFNDALVGTYVFSFYMRDKVGNLATVKIDSLEVY